MSTKTEQTKAIITEQNINLAKSLLKAIAWVQTVRPIVKAYQTKILAENVWYNDRELELGFDEIEKERVLNPDLAYNLSEENFAEYLKQCDIHAAKNNLAHKPECCPLLEAENLYRDARSLFAESMLLSIPEYKGITLDQLLVYQNNKTDKMHIDVFVDLSLKLLTPYIK